MACKLQRRIGSQKSSYCESVSAMKSQPSKDWGEEGAWPSQTGCSAHVYCREEPAVKILPAGFHVEKSSTIYPRESPYPGVQALFMPPRGRGQRHHARSGGKTRGRCCSGKIYSRAMALLQSRPLGFRMHRFEVRAVFKWGTNHCRDAAEKGKSTSFELAGGDNPVGFRLNWPSTC